MGTTSTALRGEQGNRIGFSLLIEGFEYVLTDAESTAAVVTAYAGTSWSQALPGLEVSGVISQSLRPYPNSIEASDLTFLVTPDRNDVFGKAVFRSKPSFATRLDALYQPAANGSGTITVKQTTAAQSSGGIFVGNVRHEYGSKGGTSFTVSTAGANKYSPYAADGGNTYARAHRKPAGHLWEQGTTPRVQDVPRKWTGKKVALYIHRIVGGTWDTYAQAHLEFAGYIARVSDSADGRTVVECKDMRGLIAGAVVGRRQWYGSLRKGINLVAGMKFRVREAPTSSGATASGALTVVSGAPSGSAEIQEGNYSLEDLISKMNAWLEGDGSLTAEWSLQLPNYAEGEVGVVFRAEFSGAAAHRALEVESTSLYWMEFLGWDRRNLEERSNGYWQAASTAKWASTISFRAPMNPFVTKVIHSSTSPLMMGTPGQASLQGYTLFLDQDAPSGGTWFNHASYLPHPYRDWANGGENYSLIQIGRRLLFAKYASDTKLINVWHGPGMALAANAEDAVDILQDGVRYGDPSEFVEVRQVVALGGTFTQIMTMLLASVDGAGTNSSTYDTLPSGAGIPWSLLGDEWIASCEAVEQGNRAQGMVVMLERSTRIEDVILPELVARAAWIIFKDGKYRLATLATPSNRTADHALTEANKAAPMTDGAPTQDITESEVTEEWLRNVFRFRYNRTLNGSYRDTIEVRDEGSISDYGESQAVQISMANSWAANAASGASVEDLVVSFIADSAGFFAKPIKLLRRSIAPTLYHMAPGDTVSISDDYVRDPTTGARGISNRAGVVLAVRHGWGHGNGQLFGEAEIAISDEDRCFVVSPCAEVDTSYSGTVDGITFTNGYANTAAGGPALKLKERAHARATDAVDASHFDDSDLVRIIEIDPATPASPDAWNRTLAASGAVSTANSYVKLASDLSSPAWSGSTKLYRVVPQLYSAVQASQQAHAFIADETDGLIENLAQPNTYGTGPQGAFAKSLITSLPSLIPTESDDEGRPLHPGVMQDMGRMVTNLVNYKCANPQSGPIHYAGITETATSYTLTATVPLFVGGLPQAGSVRRLLAAPRIRVDGAGSRTAYCRLTISRSAPRGDSLTGHFFEGPIHRVEFTSMSIAAYGEVPTAQSLRLPGGGQWGIVWLSVELKTSAGTMTWWGIPVLKLEALS